MTLGEISQTIEISGRSRGLDAQLRYHEGRLHWRAKKRTAASSLEEFVAEIGEIKSMALTEQRWTSASGLGAVALGLGVFWLLHASAPPAVCIGVAAFGLAMVVLRLVDPNVTLSLRAAGQNAVLAVGRTSITSAMTLVSQIENARPDLKTNRSASLWTTLGKSMRDLVVPDSSLRARYRALAGASATQQNEERAIRVQRRIAAWNVSWLMVLPLIASGAAQFAMVEQSPSGLALRIVIWCVISFFAFAMIQSRLLRVYAIRAWLNAA